MGRQAAAGGTGCHLGRAASVFSINARFFATLPSRGNSLQENEVFCISADLNSLGRLAADVRPSLCQSVFACRCPHQRVPVGAPFFPVRMNRTAAQVTGP
jgi:hypothetical protein